MSSGVEEIEAKLAAYIDGELGEDDRAEIEKYLNSNPAHRQLIDELHRNRQMLATLPRARAPVEVLDHLQSHLERSALLNNVEHDAAGLSTNRWPQFAAAAAILFLTSGLGVLIYQVLPGGGRPEQIAVLQSPTNNVSRSTAKPTGRDNGGNAGEIAKENTREGDEALALKELAALTPAELKKRLSGDQSIGSADAPTSSDLSSIESTARTDGAAGGSGSGTFGHAADSENGANPAGQSATTGATSNGQMKDVSGSRQDFIAESARRLERSLSSALNQELRAYSPPTNAGAIVVATDDPPITQNLLAGYLRDNNFEYQVINAGVIKKLQSEIVVTSTTRAAASGSRSFPPASAESPSPAAGSQDSTSGLSATTQTSSAALQRSQVDGNGNGAKFEKQLQTPASVYDRQVAGVDGVDGTDAKQSQVDPAAEATRLSESPASRDALNSTKAEANKFASSQPATQTAAMTTPLDSSGEQWVGQTLRSIRDKEIGSKNSASEENDLLQRQRPENVIDHGLNFGQASHETNPERAAILVRQVTPKQARELEDYLNQQRVGRQTAWQYTSLKLQQSANLSATQPAELSATNGSTPADSRAANDAATTRSPEELSNGEPADVKDRSARGADGSPKADIDRLQAAPVEKSAVEKTDLLIVLCQSPVTAPPTEPAAKPVEEGR